MRRKYHHGQGDVRLRLSVLYHTQSRRMVLRSRRHSLSLKCNQQNRDMAQRQYRCRYRQRFQRIHLCEIPRLGKYLCHRRGRQRQERLSHGDGHKCCRTRKFRRAEPDGHVAEHRHDRFPFGNRLSRKRHRPLALLEQQQCRCGNCERRLCFRPRKRHRHHHRHCQRRQR